MLPKLTHIELSSCRYITAKTVGILETTSTGMNNRGVGIVTSILKIYLDSPIAELVLNKCGMVKLAGLNWAFPNLVRLEISQYFMANDGILHAMSRNCPLLEKLVLSGCHTICTDGITLPLHPTHTKRENSKWAHCNDKTVHKTGTSRFE
jgi:hypothetical protein